MMGSPHTLPSWSATNRERTRNDLIRSMAVWLSLVPCWIVLLGPAQVVQCIILCGLVVTETMTIGLVLRTYWTGIHPVQWDVLSGGRTVVQLHAKDLNTVQRLLEFGGTLFFVVPCTRNFGFVLLTLTFPFVYESIQRQLAPRVLYVAIDSGGNNSSSKNNKRSSQQIDSQILHLWMQAAAMGTKLVVGIVGTGSNSTEMVLTACAYPYVDSVIVEAPSKADVWFLEKHGIDFVVVDPSQCIYVTSEVIEAQRVVTLCHDNVARLVESKTENKTVQ